MKPESPAALWFGVIRADVKAASRHAAIFLSHWWRDVAAWFRFVHHRRVDNRYPVFGDRLRTAEGLAIAGSVIVLLVLVADPLFMGMLQDRNAMTMAIFRRITEIGEAVWAIYAAGAVLLAISLMPRGKFSRRRRVDLHDVQLAAYFLFTTTIFSGLLVNLLKNLFGRARPEFTPEGLVWFANPFGDYYDFASFPSGHATTAGALAMGLSLMAPRLRVFIFLAGGWIAISRPVLGVHFPSDIVAGFCLGAWFSWVYARSFARKRLLFAFSQHGSIRLAAAFTQGRTIGGRQTLRIGHPRQ